MCSPEAAERGAGCRSHPPAPGAEVWPANWTAVRVSGVVYRACCPEISEGQEQKSRGQCSLTLLSFSSSWLRAWKECSQTGSETMLNVSCFRLHPERPALCAEQRKKRNRHARRFCLRRECGESAGLRCACARPPLQSPGSAQSLGCRTKGDAGKGEPQPVRRAGGVEAGGGRSVQGAEAAARRAARVCGDARPPRLDHVVDNGL